jgi:hypothetical protein
MPNHCHNTITITGPEAELKKFSAADAGHRFGWELSKKTIEQQSEGAVPILTLEYGSITSWAPPLKEIEKLSRAFADLRFEIECSFIPGEGEWEHHALKAGKWLGRCPGGWRKDEREPCAAGNDYYENVSLVYGVLWQYCEKHKTRWSLGDHKHRPCTCISDTSPAEQERVFNLLGAGEGVPEESAHGWITAADGSYTDVDNADRRFWRATVMYRDRQRADEAEAAALGLTVEELNQKRYEEMTARYRAKKLAENLWNALMFASVPADDEIPF